MQLEIVQKDERSLVIKVLGEDHTLCNLMRKALHDDEHVIAASYVIEHPLTDSPKIYVKTKVGKSPERALTDAAERVAEQLNELRKQLSKELKK